MSKRPRRQIATLAARKSAPFGGGVKKLPTIASESDIDYKHEIPIHEPDEDEGDTVTIYVNDVNDYIRERNLAVKKILRLEKQIKDLNREFNEFETTAMAVKGVAIELRSANKMLEDENERLKRELYECTNHRNKFKSCLGKYGVSELMLAKGLC